MARALTTLAAVAAFTACAVEDAPPPPPPTAPAAIKKPAGVLAPTSPGISIATGFGGFADLHSHPAVHRGFNGIANPAADGTGQPDWSPMWSANVGGAVDNCWDLTSCSTPGVSDTADAYLKGNTGPIKTSYALLQTGDGGANTRRHQRGHWANDIDLAREAHRDFVTGALANLAGHGHLDQLTVPTEPNGAASTLQRADGWPNARDLIHEQMTPAMVYRAFRGGQRLLVAAATDSQALTDVWNSGSAAIGTYSSAVPLGDRDFSGRDLGSLRAQLAYIRLIAKKNWRWMCIVTTPQQAARVINGDDFTHAELPDCAPLTEDPLVPGSPSTTVGATGKVLHGSGNPNPPPTSLVTGGAISGRMAVVLAAEMDSLTARQIVDLYEQDGVRVATPIHLVDSYFGGSALYIDLFDAATDYYCYRDSSKYRDARCGANWNAASQTYLMPPFEAGGAYDPLLSYRPSEPALKLRFGDSGAPLWINTLIPTPLTHAEFEANYDSAKAGGVRNAKGLAANGAAQLRRLMARGMMIDVAHMSQQSTEDTLSLAESLATSYPLIDTHTGLRDDTAPGTPGKSGEGHSERDLLASHATRLAQLGGLVGVGTADAVDVRHLGDPVDTSGAPAKKANIYNGQDGSFAIPDDLDGNGDPLVHAIAFAGNGGQIIDQLRVTVEATGSYPLSDGPGAYLTVINRAGQVVGTGGTKFGQADDDPAVVQTKKTITVTLSPPQLRSSLAQLVLEPSGVGAAESFGAFAAIASQPAGGTPTGGVELHVQDGSWEPGASIADRPYQPRDPSLVHLFAGALGPASVAPAMLDADVTSVDVMVWTGDDNLNGADYANLNDSAAFAYLGVKGQTAFDDNALTASALKDLKADELAGWSQNVCVASGQWSQPCPSGYTDFLTAYDACHDDTELGCWPEPYDPAGHPGHPVILDDFQIAPAWAGGPYAAQRFAVQAGVKVKDVTSFAIQAFVHGHDSLIFDNWRVRRVAVWLNAGGQAIPLSLWSGDQLMTAEGPGTPFVLEHTGGGVTESAWVSTLRTFQAPPGEAAPAYPSDPARHVELTIQPANQWNGHVMATLYTWKPNGVHAIDLNKGEAWSSDHTYKVIIGLPAGTVVGDLVGMSLHTVGGGSAHNQVTWLSLDTHPDPAPVWIARYLQALTSVQAATAVWSAGHGVALGTDINGLQDQVPFMELAAGVFGGDTTNVIKGRQGAALVDYTFDLTRDGIAHYGMLGDFVAGLAAYASGATARAAINNTAQDFLTSWSRTDNAALALRTVKPVRDHTSAVAKVGATTVTVSLDEDCLMTTSCTTTLPPWSDSVWQPLRDAVGGAESAFWSAGGTLQVVGNCLGAVSTPQPPVGLASFGATTSLTCAAEGCASPAATAQALGSDMVGCKGQVAWSSRASLCAPGFVTCRAEWWTSLRAGAAPTHHYWTDDNLRWSGTGSGTCAAQLAGGNACGGGPMRVCAGTTPNATDPLMNKCTWSSCGLSSNAPTEYFGGCSNGGAGYTTAGTLCCRAPCADGTVEQTFAGGMFGCAGTVAFASAATLCGTGYHVCTAPEWVARRAGAAPTYHYWTADNLRWSGSGVGTCAARMTGGSTCSGGPMRVCAGTTANAADPLANKCTWSSCGLDANAPGEFFGGCSNGGAGYTTAGALCCAD